MSRIQKWGNSLAVRIPVGLASKLQVAEGSQVDLEVRDGELVVRPVLCHDLSLKELLKDCKPSQLHGETDLGPDLGREIIA